MYYWLSLWAYLLAYRVVYLVVTAAFYYFADFGFGGRTTQIRVVDNQEAVDWNVNMSKAVDSTEDSLLVDNSES